MQKIIALILISLSVIDLWLIGQYNIVRALYDVGDPFIAVLLLGGVGLCVGIIGFCLLIGSDK